MSIVGFLLVLAASVPEIPESQLVTSVGGQEVFAPAFRGVWSKSTAACADEDSVDILEITDTHIHGYEWDGRLLMTTPMIWQGRTLTGPAAHTVVILTADREETEVAIGKHRISLFDEKLYMSNPDRTSEEKHFSATFAYVRCTRPQGAGGL